MTKPYLRHLASSADLVTSYEATRAGFVALALEKNRQISPYVEQARSLKVAAAAAQAPRDLLSLPNIRAALLTAAAVSDKANTHLLPEDREIALENLVQNHLEPAGDHFIEELVFRFLLVRGDTLGGSMRNFAGMLAQRKLTGLIIAALRVAGLAYRWLHTKASRWIPASEDEAGIEPFVRGIRWHDQERGRLLLYNLKAPLVDKNVDLCLFDCSASQSDAASVVKDLVRTPAAYIALGELKGGIDPAGADEHWKTANTALSRIRDVFAEIELRPSLFFVGAAVEPSMAGEIWQQLESGQLTNAANLTDDDQAASLAQWLCNL